MLQAQQANLVCTRFGRLTSWASFSRTVLELGSILRLWYTFCEFDWWSRKSECIFPPTTWKEELQYSCMHPYSTTGKCKGAEWVQADECPSILCNKRSSIIWKKSFFAAGRRQAHAAARSVEQYKDVDIEVSKGDSLAVKTEQASSKSPKSAHNKWVPSGLNRQDQSTMYFFTMYTSGSAYRECRHDIYVQIFRSFSPSQQDLYLIARQLARQKHTLERLVQTLRKICKQWLIRHSESVEVKRGIGKNPFSIKIHAWKKCARLK